MSTTPLWSSMLAPTVAVTGIGRAAAPSYSIGHNGTISAYDSSGTNTVTDIKIGDTSLSQFMSDVSKRLAIMVPDPRLEQEWEELRELGDRYRALEKECLDKAKVWGILERK